MQLVASGGPWMQTSCEQLGTSQQAPSMHALLQQVAGLVEAQVVPGLPRSHEQVKSMVQSPLQQSALF
jgi:hypothetical protein